MRLTGRLIAAVVIGVATTAVAAGPAAAQVIDRDLYSFTETTFFTACDGVDVQVVDNFRGQFKIRLHDSESKAYVFDNYTDDSVYTNLQTHRSWTTKSNFVHLDVSIELVSGTVYRYTWQDAGTFKIFDETGKLDRHSNGLIRESALVDTKGNLDLEDDEYLTQLSFTMRGHYPDGDFCADLEAFTTG
jgi:hypothetical protein